MQMVGNEVNNGGRIIVVPVKADAVIKEASLIALDANGFASEAAKGAGITVIGRSEQYIDNSGGADGEVTINVKRGAFVWSNDAADPVEEKDVMKQCYILDSKTVTMTSEANSVAGKVIGLEDGYVKVETI